MNDPRFQAVGLVIFDADTDTLEPPTSFEEVDAIWAGHPTAAQARAEGRQSMRDVRTGVRTNGKIVAVDDAELIAQWESEGGFCPGESV